MELQPQHRRLKIIGANDSFQITQKRAIACGQSPVLLLKCSTNLFFRDNAHLLQYTPFVCYKLVLQIADDIKLDEMVRSKTMSRGKFVITADKVRAMFRYEIPYREVVPEGVKDSDVIYETYYIQWEDIETLLENLERANPSMEEFYGNWGDPRNYRYFHSSAEMDDADSYFLASSSRIYEQLISIFHYPENQAEAMMNIVKILHPLYHTRVERFEPECHCADYINFKRIRMDIESYKQDIYDESDMFLWTDETMAEYLDDDYWWWFWLPTLEDEEIVDYRNHVESLCKKGFPQAIAAKACSCCGGDKMFECDWQFARDSYLWLLGLDSTTISDEKRCQYADALGYIYYHGYCGDGVPEYDKAFYYFTKGAAMCRMSVLGLSDMFLNGYGTEKNALLAKKLATDVYVETKDMYLHKNYECEFAETALRMGIIFKNEYLDSENSADALKAYGYLLEASDAICSRKYQRDAYKYKDMQTKLQIEKEIDQLKPICECEKPEGKSKLCAEPDFFFELLKNRNPALFCVKHLSDNEVEINADRIQRCLPHGSSSKSSIIPKENFVVEELLIVLPEYGFCKNTFDVTYRFKQVKKIWISEDKEYFKANHLNRVRTDTYDKYMFYCDNILMAYIDVERNDDKAWELLYDYRAFWAFDLRRDYDMECYELEKEGLQ